MVSVDAGTLADRGQPAVDLCLPAQRKQCRPGDGNWFSLFQRRLLRDRTFDRRLGRSLCRADVCSMAEDRSEAVDQPNHESSLANGRCRDRDGVWTRTVCWHPGLGIHHVGIVYSWQLDSRRHRGAASWVETGRRRAFGQSSRRGSAAVFALGGGTASVGRRLNT